MTGNPHCSICGGSTEPDRAAWRFLALDRAPKRYVIHRCNGCGLRWLDPCPRPEDYQRLYGEDYYVGEREVGGSYREDKDALAPCSVAVVRRLQALGVANGLLDVGCGTGDFLLAAARGGIAGTGIEPSRYAAQNAQARGLRVHHGTLDDFPAPSSPYASAHCSHVLEHVPDAHAFLERLRTLLRPDAPVYVEVPLQFDGILDRIALWRRGDRCFSDLSIHHHYFFSPDALMALLDRHGFQVTSLTTFLACRRQRRTPGPRKWAIQTLLRLANRLARRGDVISIWAQRRR